MSLKRRWTIWPARAAGELNGVSGVAGLGGIALGVAGLAGVAGTAAVALESIGAVMVVGAVGYALVMAVPPRTRGPEEFVGQKIGINELKNILPAVPTLAIIGDTQAGKTTLRNRLSLDPALVDRTQEISAFIVSLQTAPPTYFAILDGGGERLAQQFKIAEQCDCLAIVIDHSKSNSDPSIDPARVTTQESFLAQIRHHLDESNCAQKLWIRFLVNKRDLWERVPIKQRISFDQFYKNEVEKWRIGKRAKDIAYLPHSNEIPNDVARFMDLIRKTAAAGR